MVIVVSDVRVVVVDSPLLMCGLVPALENVSPGCVAASLGQIDVAAALCAQVNANVLLVGDQVAGMSATAPGAVMSVVAAAGCDAAVVALVHAVSVPMAVRWLDAGALGYVGMNASTGELWSVCSSAAGGRVAVDAEVEQAVTASRLHRDSSGVPKVSPKELEVLALMRDGVTSTADLAEALGVAPRTVRTHLERLYAEFSVNDRAGLLAAAWSWRVLDAV